MWKFTIANTFTMWSFFTSVSVSMLKREIRCSRKPIMNYSDAYITQIMSFWETPFLAPADSIPVFPFPLFSPRERWLSCQAKYWNRPSIPRHRYQAARTVSAAEWCIYFKLGSSWMRGWSTLSVFFPLFEWLQFFWPCCVKLGSSAAPICYISIQHYHLSNLDH